MDNSKTIRKAKEAFSKGKFKLATELLDQVLIENKENIECLILRGEAYLRTEKYEQALSDYALVVQLDSKNIIALNNLGAALIRCNRRNEAKEIFEYLIELQPENLDAAINLSSIYNDLRNPQMGMKMAFKAISINPRSAIAYNNLGSAFADLMLLNEAEEAFKTAYELDNKAFNTVINLAQIQERLFNRDGAIDLYEKLLSSKTITPNETELVKYYLSYSYLYKGSLSKGWDYYEHGFTQLLPPGAIRSVRKFSQPRWNGERLNNQRLLIWREQGLGDEIEFLTCLQDVVDFANNVVLECDARLVEIYKRIYPEIEVRPQWVGPDNFPVINDFDLQCPIGSLPRLFRKNLADFDKTQKNFIPLPQLVDKLRERISLTDKLLVGISWRSGLLSAERNQHYSGLPDWKDFLQRKDIQFVNLQYGDCESEILEIETELGISILRWPDIDLKNDLESVIALISLLDCVVSPGTAVSSISAMVGVKTILLTKKNWIFLGCNDYYPWYSSVIPLIASDNTYIAEMIKYVPNILGEIFPDIIKT